MERPVSKMSSAFEVGLQVRYTLQKTLEATMSMATLGVDTLIAHSAVENTATKGAPPTAGSAINTALAGRPGGPAGGDGMDTRTIVNDPGMVAAAYHAMSADQRVTWVRARMPTSVIFNSGDVFRAAVIRFPSSAFLHVFQARLVLSIAERRHDFAFVQLICSLDCVSNREWPPRSTKSEMRRRLHLMPGMFNHFCAGSTPCTTLMAVTCT